MKKFTTPIMRTELRMKGVSTKYNIYNDGKITYIGNNGIVRQLIPQAIKGRLYAKLMIDDKLQCRRLDYLVAENFKSIPENPIRLIHIDEDMLNCHVDNLMWLTKQDIIDQYINEYQIDEDIALEEVWREIDTPMGLLEVSSFGMVRWADSKELIPQYDSHGYRVIYYTLKGGNDRETKILNVHRLVAEAFIPNPNNLDVVNHLDTDKSNCHVWNLEWADRSMNTEHAFLYEKVSRYTDKQLHSVCRLIVDNKLSHVQIAMITGVDRKTISDIYRGRRHKELIDQYVFPAKKWSKELSLEIIDLVNQGYKGKEVLIKLGLPLDRASISFYERSRRQYKYLITV